MATPTHILIFKSKDAAQQNNIQEMVRSLGMTTICDFAATGTFSKEAEKRIREENPTILDQVDSDDHLVFFGRVDGRPVAP